MAELHDCAFPLLDQVVITSDRSNARFEERMLILDRIQRDKYLPLDLYLRLKKSLRYKYDRDTEELNAFIDELPANLKMETTPYIHEEIWSFSGWNTAARWSTSRQFSSNKLRRRRG